MVFLVGRSAGQAAHYIAWHTHAIRGPMARPLQW